jgi:predicted PurR-regulated permease PerM
MVPLRSELEQSLGWIVLALLLGGCLLVMLPFVTALLWGTVLSVSSWPLYRGLFSWLIFCGVIGGGIAFGFTGLFLGPPLLAVGYRLVGEWTSNHPAPTTAEAPVPSKSS